MSPVDVVFGGGGTAPAIAFADGDRRISLSWPAELPKPKADKDSAVYSDVLPGVDLRVTAGLSGFTQVLVVKTAEAARNPALGALKLVARTSGMTLATAADGILSTHDSAGNVVFRGSTPIMWDSRKDPAGAVPTANDPGSGRITRLTVAQKAPQLSAVAKDAATDVTITAAPEALTGKDVAYPVYLDPGLSRTKEAWLGLTEKNWRQWNTNYPAQVGYCAWSNCGETFLSRSFFRFDTTAVQSRNGRKAVLTSAFVYALQTHSVWDNCQAEPTDVYWGYWFDGNTSWPGPEGGWAGQESSGRGDNCRDGAGTVKFPAAPAVQKAIDDNWNRLTVYLRAPDEKNKYQWKKFDPNPTLEATFNFPPNTPGDLGVAGAVSCYNRLTTPTDRPTLNATATDNNNPPLDLDMTFEVWSVDETTRWRTGTVRIPSGGRASWAPADGLPHGEVKFRTKVKNITGDKAAGIESDWSPWKTFAVRDEQLTGTPEVYAVEREVSYPNGYWGQQSGAPGLVNFNHKNSTFPDKNVVGFSYTFMGPGTETVPSTTDCDYDRTFGTSGGWVSTSNGFNRIQLPPGLSPGYHTIHARTFDDAHKMSPESQALTIYVAPNTGGATTRIEAESMRFYQPAGQNIGLSAQHSCCEFKWSNDQQVEAGFTAVGQKASFDFTVPDTGDPTGAEWEIGLGTTSAPAYGATQYYLDGTKVGQVWPGAAPGVTYHYEPVPMRQHSMLVTSRMT
ncbi:MAG TPA: SGNH hydrolase, partial [Lentzea sp.]